MALGGSLFQPFVRFAVILRYSFPFVVKDGKVALCGGIAPDSRFFQPLSRFVVVLCDALSFFVEEAEVVGGGSVFLCSGFFPPFTCFSVVLRYTLAVVVEVTEDMLRVCIAGLREGLPFFPRGGVVLLLVSLLGGGYQRGFFAVAQGMGGACSEEEGKAEGFVHGGFLV